jgi:hypothetical protein
VKPGWAICVILERACVSDLHRADSVEIRRLSEGFVPKKKLVVSGQWSVAGSPEPDQLPA